MSSRNLGVHFSSNSDEWATPPDLYAVLDQEFHIGLDVCATAQNAKCDRYFGPEQDGLRQVWDATSFMNPPFSTVATWMAKAHQAGQSGITVVCLVPARPDTGWWFEHARFGEVRFLRGRLRLIGAPSDAPFPSAVVIFGREPCVKWWADPPRWQTTKGRAMR